MSIPEDEWKKKLDPERYRVLRGKGTEPPFTGKLLHNKEKGVYTCGGCGVELFADDAKFDSGSGWPSFYEAIGPDRIEEIEDTSHGMRRLEIVCRNCKGHLGHVFPDGPRPTGLRYCVNSLSLDFKPK
jgi:peptide-methionine (R)-S-oxide reductase